MSPHPAKPARQAAEEREPTLFDSLSRLVPEELQTAYYRVLAHTRTLNPDDEMLRILEAMGVLALLTRQTPRDIADERERIQEALDAHQSSTDVAQQKMLGYVHELESRLSTLPGKIEAGLNPQQIAQMLGESLRQNFLQSGVPDTVRGLQATAAAMTSAQKELTTALNNLSDSRDGVAAQVEHTNNRLTHSLESRAKNIDALLLEWKSDLLRVWIPLIAGAALLIGLLSGMRIQSCRDSASITGTTPSAMQTVPDSVPQTDSRSVVHSKQHRRYGRPAANAGHKRLTSISSLGVMQEYER